MIGLLAAAASNGSSTAGPVTSAVGIGIWALLVLSRANDLVGIVSLGDLATEAGDPGQPGEVLKKVSEPA